MNKLTKDKIRIIKTSNLYICVCISGMCMSAIGPSLLDLQHIVQTDTRQISLLYTARSSGYALGSLLGGIIFDATEKKQLILTILNLLISGSVAAIPWSRSIGTLAASMVFNGVAMAALDTGSNVCIFNYWGKESAPFYQALHFTYGVGGLIAPLIVAPFLGNFTEDSSMFLNHTYMNGSSNSTAHLPSQITGLNPAFDQTLNDTLPSIVYPYAIIGALGLMVTCLFIMMTIVAPVDTNVQKEQGVQTRKQSKVFMVSIVALTFFLLFFETGTEIGYAQMLTTYAVKGSLKLTKTRGSYMTSAFWGAFTVSRFFSIFMAMRWSNLAMIIFDVIISSAGGLVLYFLALEHEWGLWLATVLLGVGIASFWPTIVAWVEEYITVTNKILSLFTVGAACGEMVVPYAISSTIEQVPESLVYVVLTTCGVCAVMVLIEYLILRKKEKKYLNDTAATSPVCDVKTEQIQHI